MSGFDAHSLQPGLLGSRAVRHYEERRPPPELSPLIDRLYLIETGGDAQLYPVVADGCADILFDCSGGLAPVASFSLCQPLPAVMDPNLCLIGARLKPGGIGRLLSVGPGGWDGGVHALNSLPLAGRWRPQVRGGDPDLLLDQLCVQLEPFARPSDAQAMIEALMQQPTEWDEAGGVQMPDVSDRHLRRLLSRKLGLSPKRFRRVRRFQQSLMALAQHPDHSLAQLASDFGYSDQAHLGHEWRMLSGRTPGFWRGRFLQEPGRPSRGD